MMGERINTIDGRTEQPGLELFFPEGPLDGYP